MTKHRTTRRETQQHLIKQDGMTPKQTKQNHNSGVMVEGVEKHTYTKTNRKSKKQVGNKQHNTQTIKHTNKQNTRNIYNTHTHSTRTHNNFITNSHTHTTTTTQHNTTQHNTRNTQHKHINNISTHGNQQRNTHTHTHTNAATGNMRQNNI